jgi:hypothetical protein
MVNPTDNQASNNNVEAKNSDKELNFRAFQQSYEKKLAEERQARLELENRLKQSSEVDDSDNEPYVDHRKLEKKLAKQHQNTQSDIQKAMEVAKNEAKDELRQEAWLENNSDFYDVLKLADKFAEKNPRLADTILRMPEGFERQKLVYQNIKALGIDKPEQKAPSIQDKIDANRKSPYYQPSGVGTAPYASQGDYSPTGQKQAYDKLQELKKNLRI